MLTQFNSHTLNTHIGKAYPPAVFGGPKKQGFVDVLACHQTPEQNSWYRGSADAVRRNLGPILEQYRGVGIPDELLILSGQAVYRMVLSFPICDGCAMPLLCFDAWHISVFLVWQT